MSVPILPAATAVLVRESTGEVLLMLRHARHGFMANVWVFPGGRVDTGDLRTDDSDDAAFLRAAIRETWEEAGILLTDPPRVAAPDESRTSALTFASSRETRYLTLEPFARWVTPPNEKRRYDTLFFLGLVPHLDAVADAGEVIDALWIHPAEAIARHRANQLPLAPPTMLTLHALIAASLPTDSPYLAEAPTLPAWSPAHASRLVSWVGDAAQMGVPALTPTLALVEGRLLVAAPIADRWPVPPQLATVSGIRLVDGHWELIQDSIR